jgi:hypothetical protein
MFLAFVMGVIALAPTSHVVRVSSTAELRSALAAATRGTRIELAPGTYGGFQAVGVAGDAERPIVVTAAKPADPPVFNGGIHFSDIAHVTLSHLVVERAPANGINIDDAGSFETPSHHVVLEDVVVRDCGGRGNDDGIKLSGVDDLAVRRCTIERWGRGGSGVDLVGCHRATIERCTLRDREDGAASSGIQAKGGSCDVAIRACRFEHAGQRAVNAGGSTGLQFFRPQPAGFEAKNVVVEGCTFVGSQAPIAFVGVDGATVRFNTFVRPTKWLLRILQETNAKDFVPCRDGVFTDNLVVYDGRETATLVNIGPDTAPETFTFARNYWFRVDDAKRSIPALPTPEAGAAGGADPECVGVGDAIGDVSATSPARAFGAHAYRPESKR